MKKRIFIDGSAGTTGLRLRQRLQAREELELVTLPEALRKDPAAKGEVMNACDIAFLCLPDAAAREAAALARSPGLTVIDTSTAHRVTPGWVYGFPELAPGQEEKIRAARRIANPGCYATGFIALVRPLVAAGALDTGAAISAHALSGYTGAGKSAIAVYESPDRPAEYASPRAYALGLAHKHLPEMMAMTGLARRPIFCPVVCDYPCGMTVTVPLHLSQLQGRWDLEALHRLYEAYYAGRRLIHVRGLGEPESGFLGANNLAGRDDLEIFVTGNGEQALCIARFDNLGKGASGAAVQCMNLVLGLDPTTGLECGT